MEKILKISKLEDMRVVNGQLTRQEIKEIEIDFCRVKKIIKPTATRDERIKTIIILNEKDQYGDFNYITTTNTIKELKKQIFNLYF